MKLGKPRRKAEQVSPLEAIHFRELYTDRQRNVPVHRCPVREAREPDELGEGRMGPAAPAGQAGINPVIAVCGWRLSLRKRLRLNGRRITIRPTWRSSRLPEGFSTYSPSGVDNLCSPPLP